MPLEARPLFRPDVVGAGLQEFDFPGISGAREKLGRWATLLSTDRGERLREQELLPDFLTDVFYGVLGYSGPAGKGTYTLSREKHVEVDGKFADAVLGRFGNRKAGDRFAVAIEGKGPRDPLDRPWAGRRMSAVDQGYRYAINLPADWIVVTNLRQVRLYHKGRDQRTFERFDTQALVDDEFAMRRFSYLLGAERVVPEAATCHLDGLLAASEKAELELTKTYYADYAELRQHAFALLRRANSKVPPERLLAFTQRLLDRILFCAFCEDRGLLPTETLRQAFEHRDPYHPKPIWTNFQGLFRAVNVGNAALKIPGYNGGLFAEDEVLDRLDVPDEVCALFKRLGDFDYRAPAEFVRGAPQTERAVDVDILGHIFEQSIADLEQLRTRIDAGEAIAIPKKAKKKPMTRRKREGAFYTPSFVTRYIIEQALGAALLDRYEALRQAHLAKASGSARKALEDPRTYDVEALNKPQREALIRFWEAWLSELETVRLVDPACGSGAFLIEAFDYFYEKYQRTNDRLEELRGHRTLFDPDKSILQNNLFGVDLNHEAVEICRLSLWIKTAQRGKKLADLDHNVLAGNSIVDDAALDPRALDWKKAFPQVFKGGGFDVVIGNPPYVRQELLSPIKPYLEKAYRTYHGVADLYVYFYERGLGLLRPGGVMSLIVTNKWMKAGYGEPLRRFFGEHAWMESVVNFGHAKQIFPDADVFPCILVARRPWKGAAPETARVCDIPREQLRVDDLSEQIRSAGFEVPRASLGPEAWNLEPPGVSKLLEKIRRAGVPLAEYVGAEPLYGIKTGFNEAFLIDTAAKEALIMADPQCSELIRPYVRGQDIKRWCADWHDLWMIVMRSSENHAWPWAGAGDNAEAIFKKTYPSLHAHFKPFEKALRMRADQGRHWWELRACIYYETFMQPKIFYQVIQFHPSYSFDAEGRYGNDKTFFLPSDDLCLLGILNSPIMWWHNFRFLPHMKDEALTPQAFKMKLLPIVNPMAKARQKVADNVNALIDSSRKKQQARDTLLDWLRVEFEVEKTSRNLESPQDLGPEEFVEEVRKARGRKAGMLTAAGLKALRDEYAQTVVPMRECALKALALEREASDLVNAAYGLTPAEVKLMWQTAPPRMPFQSL